MKLETIKLGRIVNTHGIRGEVRVQPTDMDPDLLTRFKTFYIDGKAVSPTSNHVHKSVVLMKFPGVDDIDAANTLRGKDLYIRRSDADFIPYFDEELLGVQVYEADNGNLLGELVQVENYPAHQIYTVRGQREYLIPAVPDVFILGLDLDENRMEVRILEGMATDEN